MSQSINTSVGKRVTFRGLFKRHDLVEIPIIQRDYAQGRTSKLESEIRSDFVRALYEALAKPAADPSLPLDLDFVYGSVENDGRKAFCPLDGQQRLTTLFLLHWYLAWKDRRFDDLAAFVRDEQQSRFSYTVRPSSHEFFDSLLGWTPDSPVLPKQPISVAITDQPWFYRSWRLTRRFKPV